jgi:transposase, IS30 family
MERKFKQFNLEDRCEIARRRQAGDSIRQIAAAVGCAPSSISRELKRNTGAGDYKPVYASEQAQGRRWKGCRLLRDPQLQAKVLGYLGRGWSPEQVSAALAKQKIGLSHESIYRFIAGQIARTKDYSWRLYLPRAKSKRGWRGRRGGSPAEHIRERVSIDQRPAQVQDRSQPGHWEADLMLFARYGQAVLALHERTSRLTVIVRQPSKAAAPVANTIRALLAPLPQALRQTMTFDNGTEFALHHTLRQPLGISTYFCDPHAPWQKGGIENAIGRLRRKLPRKTDLATLSNRQLLDLMRAYNHTPRKCLGYKTPAQVFAQVLHFNCEFTFPPTRE